MSRTINKLTDRKIQSIKTPGRHSDGGGLYVRVSKSGSKSFSFRAIRDGQATEIGLGAYPIVGLAAARQQAETLRQRASAGQGLKTENEPNRPQSALSFAMAADAYITSIESGFKNEKHKAQWRMTLGPTYCSNIVNRPVDSIGLTDILTVVKPIWNTKAETAYRIRGRLERVLEFARVQGWREGENPARWRGNLDAILPTTHKVRNERHFEAVEYSDLPAIFSALQSKQTVGAKALQFAILTACRTNEVIGARWNEFDIEKKRIWVVPEERMKRGVEHTVPLSTQAITLLLQLTENRLSDLVFPGVNFDRPISNVTMLKVLKDMGRTETVHGFRSTFTDWIAEETDFSPALADFALAHGLKNKTTAAYRRLTAVEKRREMMQSWADYCCSENNRD